MLDMRVRPPRFIAVSRDAHAWPAGYADSMGAELLPNTPEHLDRLLAADVDVLPMFQFSHHRNSTLLTTTTTAATTRVGHPLRGLVPLLQTADVAFANLECPLSTRGRPTKVDQYYRAAPRYARHLSESGIDVVSLANNHAFDFGEVAFDDTRRALRRYGVQFCGAGRDLAAARAPAIVSRHEASVAFLAYAIVADPASFADAEFSGIAPFSTELATEDIRSARRRVDRVVVSIHWGAEGEAVPRQSMRRAAHSLIRAGADVVAGHHPHRFGSIEVIDGRPVFYSLGNIVFGHTHEHWGHTAVARVRFAARGAPQVELVPVANTGAHAFSPEPLRGAAAQVLVTEIARLSAPFGTRIGFDEEREIGIVDLAASS